MIFILLALFSIMPAGRLGPLAGSAHRRKFGAAVIDKTMMSCQGSCILEINCFGKLQWDSCQWAKLKVPFKHRDARPSVCPFLLLCICNSRGETEKSPLFPDLWFSSLSPLSLSFNTEASQQCQEAGMPREGKNSPQWQRSLLFVFVYLQLSGRRIHTRGKSNWVQEARAFCKTNLQP